MKRLVYVAFGATLAVLVYRKAEQVSESLTPVGRAGHLSDSLAVLGMVLHFVLDGWLQGLRLGPVLTEGIGQGVRAAWVTVGLLVLVLSWGRG